VRHGLTNLERRRAGVSPSIAEILLDAQELGREGAEDPLAAEPQAVTVAKLDRLARPSRRA
jgi:hypothetical protein